MTSIRYRRGIDGGRSTFHAGWNFMWHATSMSGDGTRSRILIGVLPNFDLFVGLPVLPRVELLVGGVFHVGEDASIQPLVLAAFSL